MYLITLLVVPGAGTSEPLGVVMSSDGLLLARMQAPPTPRATKTKADNIKKGYKPGFISGVFYPE
jgi:hypothetical protein